MASLEAIAGRPGQFTLAGKTYDINPPTPRDMMREMLQMKEFAQAECTSPVNIASQYKHLDEAVFRAIVSEALRLEANKFNMQPTDHAVRAMYAKVEPLRWRVEFHIKRSGGLISKQELEKITSENLVDVADELDKALRFEEIEPGKDDPSTGTNS